MEGGGGGGVEAVKSKVYCRYSETTLCIAVCEFKTIKEFISDMLDESS